MSEKKRGLAEFLGLSGVDPVTGEALPLSPLDGAATGLQRLGERGSAALRPLGAKLDAKIGTGPKARPPRAQDPLLTEPPAEMPPMGLFETLGHSVPHVASAVAGLKMPMDGPTGPGVAAFPSPKQSLKAMQEHAMVRDALESRGALREVTPSLSVDAQPGPVPGTNPHKIGSPKAYAEDVRQINEQGKALAANEARGGTGAEAFGGLRRLEQDANDWAATGVRGYGPERTHAWPEYGSAPPVGPVTRDASELERYLSGLFGPKAPK